MSGILYGIGVGPGDPELMTVKALRLIRESDVIAVPGADIQKSMAYRIAKGAYPELEKKSLLPVPMPMTKDRETLDAVHREGADAIERCLKDGKQVAFLTLGDPTVYSTCLYIHRIILERGYEASIISGVPSFCAAAARVNMGLSEMAQALHIIPATYSGETMEHVLALPGTKVLMKAGKELKRVRQCILESGKSAVLVENCGMDGERIYRDPASFPENASYYSLIIVKDRG